METLPQYLNRIKTNSSFHYEDDIISLYSDSELTPRDIQFIKTVVSSDTFEFNFPKTNGKYLITMTTAKV